MTLCSNIAVLAERFRWKRSSPRRFSPRRRQTKLPQTMLHPTSQNLNPNLSLSPPSKSPSHNQSTISQSTISQSTSSQNTISQNTISQNTISQSTSSQNTISQNTTSQNTTNQNTSSQNTTNQNTTSQSTTNQNLRCTERKDKSTKMSESRIGNTASFSTIFFGPDTLWLLLLILTHSSLSLVLGLSRFHSFESDIFYLTQTHSRGSDFSALILRIQVPSNCQHRPRDEEAAPCQRQDCQGGGMRSAQHWIASQTERIYSRNIQPI